VALGALAVVASFVVLLVGCVAAGRALSEDAPAPS
jgi:hypothetical protein